MERKKIIIISLAIIFLLIIVSIIFVFNKKQTFEVTFKSNGGTPVEKQIIEKGNKVLIPEDPVRENYIFMFWTYQGSEYDFNTLVEKNMTLEAKWMEKEEDIENFLVRFNSDGGTYIQTQTVEKGKKAEKPIDPIKEGFIFKYWTLNELEYDFNKEVESNIELKAFWEEVKETKTTTSTNTTNDNKKTNSNTNTNNNNQNTSSNTNNNNNNQNTGINNPVQPQPKQKYTVTFNSNGGSTVASQTIEEGNKATQPTNPTRSGYNFDGWLLNGNAYNFNTPVNSNITLTAKWKEKSYTIVATKVDAYSPDSILSVYEQGIIIRVREIRYSDGTYLCSGSNATVNTGDILDETRFIVVLNDGTQVNAMLA